MTRYGSIYRFGLILLFAGSTWAMTSVFDRIFGQLSHSETLIQVSPSTCLHLPVQCQVEKMTNSARLSCADGSRVNVEQIALNQATLKNLSRLSSQTWFENRPDGSQILERRLDPNSLVRIEFRMTPPRVGGLHYFTPCPEDPEARGKDRHVRPSS